jgi:hypothetical protein
MNIEKFVDILEIISKKFDGTVEKTETSIIFSFGNSSYSEDISTITETINKMLSMNKSDFALYNETTYEMALDRRLDIMRLIDRNEMGIIEDCENQIKYTITNASPEYVLWFLSSLTEREIRTIRDFSFSRSMLMNRGENQENTQVSLLIFLCQTLRSLLTLRIQSIITKTKPQFEQLFDSFRFQMTNYYNDVIMPIEDFKDLGLRPLGRRMVNIISDFTAPKRIYNEELTNQYYMGISSKLPFVEFISYYHVMEYFFEKVYNDEMIKNLQDKISSPRFSVKREKDIKEIVKYVNKKVRDKNEHYDINEQEALELVLRKYIEITELVNTISASFIDYYKSTEVPFSKGDIIDFNDILNPILLKKISARIYKTRNSIIHSKSGDKAIYSPFKDDKSLEKEIPLLRYIAEEIIIKTSKIM